MTYSCFEYDLRDHVAHVTMCRGDDFNTMTKAFWSELPELIDKISIKTRQYAKRQSTWARGHMKDWNKVNPVGLDKLLKKI